MADGPAAGLALVRRLEADGALAGYYLLPATRADFLRRLGRDAEAASAYAEAAAMAGTGPERRFLTARLEEARARAAEQGNDLTTGRGGGASDGGRTGGKRGRDSGSAEY